MLLIAKASPYFFVRSAVFITVNLGMSEWVVIFETGRESLLSQILDRKNYTNERFPFSFCVQLA